MTTQVATAPATWTIDPAHTDVAFSVRHMGLSTVRGRFERVAGTVDTGADGAPTAVRIEIETASINTGSKDRDAHLRSGDFFDADANPTITFVSDRVTELEGGRFEVAGDLTMHGVTKPVVLDAEIGAPITDPWGAQRRAATASAKLNRKDWGLTWNQILEAGALLVSEDVKLSIDVQVTQQA
jgi:polyisoprenoid-binding protein YceI